MSKLTDMLDREKSKKTKAKITFQDGSWPYYNVSSAGECRAEVDRSAYLEAIAAQTSIQMGKVCVELLES